MWMLQCQVPLKNCSAIKAIVPHDGRTHQEGEIPISLHTVCTTSLNLASSAAPVSCAPGNAPKCMWNLHIEKKWITTTNKNALKWVRATRNDSTQENTHEYTHARKHAHTHAGRVGLADKKIESRALVLHSYSAQVGASIYLSAARRRT